MSAGLPPVPQQARPTVSIDTPSSIGESALVRSALAVLACEAGPVYWMAIIQAPVSLRDDALDGVAWPEAAVAPEGVIALSARALETGRVTRAVLGEQTSAPEGELLAIPSGMTVAGRQHLYLVASEPLDELRRAGLLRRLRDDTSVAEALQSSAAGSLSDDILKAIVDLGDLDSVALYIADTFSRRHDVRRVTIVIERGGDPALLAMSGESRLDPRREINRQLLAIAAHVLASDRPVDVPFEVEESAAGRRIGEMNGGLGIATFLASPAGLSRLVAIVEHETDVAAAVSNDAALRASLTCCLGVLSRLDDRRQSSFARASSFVSDTLTDLRRGRPSRRLMLSLPVAALVAAWLFVPLDYRVSGRVSVDALDRQVLVAPYAGHVLSAQARAGDRVSKDEVLATLDDRELLLALDKWQSELAKNATEQAQALAARNRVELARLRSDARRLDAERELVAERRARADIKAPYDGIVLSGDPTRSLGAPVEAGDVLFELARGDQRTVRVEIDERDIATIDAVARVDIRMAALPKQVFAATLDRQVPVAVSEAGQSFFRVPATLVENDQSLLRPGMNGVARIHAGRRSLADAWTRGLRHRLIVILWKLGLVG